MKQEKVKQGSKMGRKVGSKTWIFGVMALVAFSTVILVLLTGMSTTINEVKEVAVSHSPEAILASSGVSEDKDLYLAVAYYDQKMDECINLYDEVETVVHRQFEWEKCGYYGKDLEQGLVKYELGEDHLPVFVAGRKMPNRGLEESNRWFAAEEGKSAAYVGAMKIEYKAEGAEFSFTQKEFYPLDDAEFSKSDEVNKDGHNHLFTMNFAVPFTVLLTGGESFEITADDDTFVYVGDKLAIDMGGVHSAMTGRFVISDKGEVYAGAGDDGLAYTGISVNAGDSSMVRIYHADRDASESVFGVKFAGMNISIVDTKVAKGGGVDYMQIAYDPLDPTYEAPLGQSVVIQPDNTRGYLTILTVEGVMVVVFSVLTVMAVKVIMRRKR